MCNGGATTSEALPGDRIFWPLRWLGFPPQKTRTPTSTWRPIGSISVSKNSRAISNSVIDWVSTVFSDMEKEMCGLEWGRLYETFHKKSYDSKKISKRVQELYGDVYVKKRSGIFEYVLSGETDTKLLEIRVFDEATKRNVYAKQTEAANAKLRR